MTRATEYITSNMSEVIRTFKHSVMKGSLQVFLPPTHSVSFAFELCGASKVVRRFTTRVKKKKKVERERKIYSNISPRRVSEEGGEGVSSIRNRFQIHSSAH